MKFTSLLTALTVASALTSSIARADDCVPVVQDLVNWTKASPYNRIAFNLTTSASPARWVAYAEGLLNGNSANGLDIVQPANQTFSDRMNAGSCTGLCFDYQKFADNKADTITISLNSSAQLTYVLKTWGNATAVYNTTCINGFIYASSGDAFQVLGYKKVAVSPPPH